MTLAQRGRIPVLLAALLALVAGAYAGLIRMGWHWEPRSSDLLAAHGSLTTVGFLGNMISLELGWPETWRSLSRGAAGAAC